MQQLDKEWESLPTVTIMGPAMELGKLDDSVVMLME